MQRWSCKPFATGWIESAHDCCGRRAGGHAWRSAPSTAAASASRVDVPVAGVRNAGVRYRVERHAVRRIRLAHRGLGDERAPGRACMAAAQAARRPGGGDRRDRRRSRFGCASTVRWQIDSAVGDCRSSVGDGDRTQDGRRGSAAKHVRQVPRRMRRLRNLRSRRSGEAGVSRALRAAASRPGERRHCDGRRRARARGPRDGLRQRHLRRRRRWRRCRADRRSATRAIPPPARASSRTRSRS